MRNFIFGPSSGQVWHLWCWTSKVRVLPSTFGISKGADFRMPCSIGIAALLEIENHHAADFSICFFNLEIDHWEVIHFPFPGSANEDFA